ncbi:MAG: FAD-dependent oxidoreductase [Fibrobacteria bacterium]|nr:FAD-dependent oxidoreductase [Fibrobacteria bacterium]
MSEHILEIDASQFDHLVGKAPLAVVDFYSDECPPCEALAPKYEALASVYGEDVKFVKIFRQKNRELAESLGVKGSPSVLFFRDGQRVGETLSGGIRRSSLQNQLDTLVGPEKAQALRAMETSRETRCDVLVVGAGPAGLTAALYAAQAKASVIVVDGALAGGAMGSTHQIANYPGFAKPVPGWQLAENFREQASQAGVQWRLASEITRLDLGDRSAVIDGLETIRAKKIVLAMGTSPRALGVPGEKELLGKGISTCATCDAKYMVDKDVVVIGGGDAALEESQLIAQFARKVTIVHRRDEFRAKPQLVEAAAANPKIEFLMETRPTLFRKNGDEMEVELLSPSGEVQTHRAGGVFLFVGMLPNVDLARDHLEFAPDGTVQVDEWRRTNVPHVFAVGDLVSKPVRQVTMAVADGTVAGIMAARELSEN